MNASQRWVAEQEKLRIEREAQARLSYEDFDEYVATYHNCEHWRNWVVATYLQWNKKYLLVPTYEGFSCLDSCHYVVMLYETSGYQGKYAERNGKFFVSLNDGDDAHCEKQVSSWEEGLAELEKLKQLAPFYYGDLKEFGYTNYN